MTKLKARMGEAAWLAAAVAALIYACRERRRDEVMRTLRSIPDDPKGRALR